MKINGESFSTLEAFKNFMTVPDCIVTNSNKLGGGHGEAKFYISSKPEMYSFYGEEGFSVKCFMLRSDLIAYMQAIKSEYMNPSQEYRKKEEMASLWNERMNKVRLSNDIIFFNIYDQKQIAGPRGYINSNDDGYQLIREIALPLVSYIYAEKMKAGNSVVYYWKLFVDFDAIYEKKNGPLVFQYGKGKSQEATHVITVAENEKEEKKKQEIRYAREGQGKYREQLLEQCHYCPITMVADERLLIASHIKPWAASDDKEKIDPYNGYMLSPLYDKLFDRGFITFTENRRMILSDFISPYTWKLLKIENNMFVKALPMDDKRVNYLKFHHQSVFKGAFEDDNDSCYYGSCVAEGNIKDLFPSEIRD